MWEFENVPSVSDAVYLRPVIVMGRIRGNWEFEVGDAQGLVTDFFFKDMEQVKSNGKIIEFLYPSMETFYIATNMETGQRMIIDEGARDILETHM